MIIPAPPAAARSAANRSTPYCSIGFQYVMTTTGTPVRATASTVRSTPAGVIPPASASSTACWITGPSSTGSEYGRPTSTTSTPASTIAVNVAAGVSPAGR